MMNRAAFALAALGLLAGVTACTGDGTSSSYEVSDTAVPYTFAISGMT